jgi:hypothetical protein
MTFPECACQERCYPIRAIRSTAGQPVSRRKSRVGAAVSQKAQAITSENPTGPLIAIGMSHDGQARDLLPSQAALSAGRSSTRPAAALSRSSRSGPGLLAGS